MSLHPKGALCPRVSPVDGVVARLVDVRSRGEGYTARCPVARCAYRLSVDAGRDGRVLLYCTGGCDAATITTALGLSLRDLFPARRRGRGPR